MNSISYNPILDNEQRNHHNSTPQQNSELTEETKSRETISSNKETDMRRTNSDICSITKTHHKPPCPDNDALNQTKIHD
jgi:hypothetical protein